MLKIRVLQKICISYFNQQANLFKKSMNSIIKFLICLEGEQYFKITKKDKHFFNVKLYMFSFYYK